LSSEVKIENLNPEEAVSLFTESFSKYPLHKIAFPKNTKKLLRHNYRFFIHYLIPEFKFHLYGLLVDGKPAGGIIFSSPKNTGEWNKRLDNGFEKLKFEAGEKSIRIIRNYIQKVSGFKPEFPVYNISEVAVLPRYRGKGYGRMLIEFVEELSAKDKKSKGIFLETCDPANVFLYKHLGYKIFMRSQIYGLKSVCMIKFNKKKTNTLK
jgi:GNAT superfamily N-acetyltransferase